VYQHEEFEVGFAPSSPDLTLDEQKLQAEEKQRLKRIKKEKQMFENYEPLKLVASTEYVDYSLFEFKKYGRMMKFFDKKLSKCIYKFRNIIFIVCMVWLIISMYLGYHISSQSTEESMLSKSLPIQQAKDIIDFMIGKEDDYIPFNFYFGVETKLYEF
jgi:hypothetical protein